MLWCAPFPLEGLLLVHLILCNSFKDHLVLHVLLITIFRILGLALMSERVPGLELNRLIRFHYGSFRVGAALDYSTYGAWRLSIRFDSSSH